MVTYLLFSICASNLFLPVNLELSGYSMKMGILSYLNECQYFCYVEEMIFPILTHALKWEKEKGLILFQSCGYRSFLTKVIIYFSSRWRKHSLKIENIFVWTKESRELGNKGSTV